MNSSVIEALDWVDLDRLIDEAEHGKLSVPLSQLPPAIQALLTPVLEQGQRHIAAEQHDLEVHRRELRRAEHVKDKTWLEEKSPEYKKAYEAFFDTVSDSTCRIDGALSELNDSERSLQTRLAELEHHAVHLPDGRLAFFENGRFVYADGSTVGPEDLAACEQAKKAADEKREPLTSWHEYSALNQALNDTVELEQRLSTLDADVTRAGDDVRKRPPDGEADLRTGAATIRQNTDDAVAQAHARYEENKRLVSSHLDVGAETKQTTAAPATAVTATTSTSFNRNAVGDAVSGRPSPKPEALDLDQVITAATADPSALFRTFRP